MDKLSVVIITLNEEKNIERCIKSVKDIADEILVVDSFSTDATEKICLEHKTNFVKHKFEGYIEQKNYAVKLAKFTYVLSIDADEALTEELKKSILEEKKEFKYDGYTFNRLANYCGKWIKHCGWYPDKKLRLINKEKAEWGGTNPHDKLYLSKESTSKHLKGDLLHYSYYSISEHVLQIEHFSNISSREMFKKGVKTNFLKQIIRTKFKFFSMYILKLGILDGYYGFVISFLSAMSVFIKFTKLRWLYKNK